MRDRRLLVPESRRSWVARGKEAVAHNRMGAGEVAEKMRFYERRGGRAGGGGLDGKEMERGGVRFRRRWWCGALPPLDSFLCSPAPLSLFSLLGQAYGHFCPCLFTLLRGVAGRMNDRCWGALGVIWGFSSCGFLRVSWLLRVTDLG